MGRRIKRNDLGRFPLSPEGPDAMGPDGLKDLVREQLFSLAVADRRSLILQLERELRAANLRMSAYLIPIGIPVSSLDELTPGDVGHLIRYLKFNVPAAAHLIDGFLEQLAVVARVHTTSERLAA